MRWAGLDDLPVKIPELWLRMNCSMSDIGGEGHIGSHCRSNNCCEPAQQYPRHECRNMEMATKGLRDFGVKVD